MWQFDTYKKISILFYISFSHYLIWVILVLFSNSVNYRHHKNVHLSQVRHRLLKDMKAIWVFSSKTSLYTNGICEIAR